MSVFSEKTFLITGASSGIGKFLVTSLADKGARVIATGRNLEELYQIKEKYPEGTINPMMLDLTQNEIDRFIVMLDKIDGYVNAAGISPLIPAKLSTSDIIQNHMQINFIGPAQLTNQLLKKRKFNKNSSIVFISSISGSGIGNIGLTNYSASKAAIIGYMKTLALETAPNIRVNSISPGMIDTGSGMFQDTIQHMSKEDIEKDLSLYPMKRFGTPEDVSNMIEFLLSDKSSWITGQNFVIDGGRMLK